MTYITSLVILYVTLTFATGFDSDM